MCTTRAPALPLPRSRARALAPMQCSDCRNGNTAPRAATADLQQGQPGLNLGTNTKSLGRIKSSLKKKKTNKQHLLPLQRSRPARGESRAQSCPFARRRTTRGARDEGSVQIGLPSSSPCQIRIKMQPRSLIPRHACCLARKVAALGVSPRSAPGWGPARVTWVLLKNDRRLRDTTPTPSWYK